MEEEVWSKLTISVGSSTTTTATTKATTPASKSNSSDNNNNNNPVYLIVAGPAAPHNLPATSVHHPVATPFFAILNLDAAPNAAAATHLPEELLVCSAGSAVTPCNNDKK
jgi:hypothetical protein